MVNITARELVDFLKQLGRCYRHSGRVYLVGGSSLILAEAKYSTLDIDLKLDIPNEHHDEFIRCLRKQAGTKSCRSNSLLLTSLSLYLKATKTGTNLSAVMVPWMYSTSISIRLP